ncbi:4-oxalocrotonate tautomerase [Moniliophthora roreri MCA 2997]|uniref:4-oxalocrotonate tautomerase n=1 Tax=Moniliophthora roreri (strain MCA 2997) TaxID=1381753 RepID=V2XC46_MONRO|nr:4-oxalocrotonate tautomerase [Moniliophthora roreri MCA 2997]
MPFHRWYCPPNLYTADEKKAIAAAITDVYKRLPAFYVVVNFINVDRENFFVGGENSDRFVRISIHHLARTLHGYEEKRAWMDKYEKAIEPWTKGKGIDWEVQIANMDVSNTYSGLQTTPHDSIHLALWAGILEREWITPASTGIGAVLHMEGDE